MSEQQDPDFLKNEEYGAAGDLQTRIRIQEAHRTNPQNWFHWLFERYNLPAHSRVLELGCGSGELWLKNLDRLPPNLEVLLSDFSFGMVQAARSTPLGEDPQFSFAVLDAQAVPFPEARFDAVIGNGLLDHLPQRRRALDEIRRVLKLGGRFFTTTGGRTHLQEIEDVVKPFLAQADFGGDPERFGLENGARILSGWFERVRRERYPDELRFEQAEPLLAYVLSEGAVRKVLAGEKLARFREFIEERLARLGALRVTSNKGLFIALKPQQ